MGATSMYIVSLISLFALRKKHPDLNRPFLVPYYPIIPMIALVLGIVCLIAMFYFNIKLGCIFFAGGLITTGLHEITIQRKKNVQNTVK